MCGYSTDRAAPVAIAASTAEPPARSASTPAAEASECGEATMPLGAIVAGLPVVMGNISLGFYADARRNSLRYPCRTRKERCMKTLRSYLGDRWVEGSGPRQTLVNPATEEPLAQASSDGLDLAAALDHARRKGGPALRALSFAERGILLKEMAKAIQAQRDELLDLAVANGGNTRSDAKFDVDGAIFTLQTYSEIGSSLGAANLLVAGEGVQLGRSPRFHGQHISVPRHGLGRHRRAHSRAAERHRRIGARERRGGQPECRGARSRRRAGRGHVRDLP